MEEKITKRIRLIKAVILLSLVLAIYSVATFVVGFSLNSKDFPYERYSVMYWVVSFVGHIMPTFISIAILYLSLSRLNRESKEKGEGGIFPKGPLFPPAGSFGFKDLKEID